MQGGAPIVRWVPGEVRGVLSPYAAAPRERRVPIRRMGVSRWAFFSSPSELRLSRGAGEGDDVTDVPHPGAELDQPLEAEPEPRVGDGPVTTEVPVPPVIILPQARLLDAPVEHVEALLALRAADDLPDLRHQHVHGADRLPVTVQAHVERLD